MKSLFRLALVSTLAVVQAQSVLDNTTQDSRCKGPKTPGELRTQFLTDYDKFSRPNEAFTVKDGGPLDEAIQPDAAFVQFHVLSLKNVDQKRNEYSVAVWFRRMWHDYRLAFPSHEEGGCFPGDSVGYPESILEEIWHPDFYIQNQAKKAEKTAGALWISPDGAVLWSSQLEVTVSCRLEFEDFPFDTQNCSIRVSTYQQDASSIVMELWPDREPVTLAQGDEHANELPHGGTTEWEIVGARGVIRNLVAGAIAEWSYADFFLEIQRRHEYYSTFVVVPAVMFVAIGWASFFINRKAAPARVGMSMIVFLANMNFMSAQLSQLPRLGNNAWLLNFLYMSTFFCFYAIVEYVLCNYLGRIEGRIVGARKKAEAVNTIPDPEDGQEQYKDSASVTKEDIVATGFNFKVDLLCMKQNGEMILTDEQVEIFSRYVYPISYITAFLIMWFSK